MTSHYAFTFTNRMMHFFNYRDIYSITTTALHLHDLSAAAVVPLDYKISVKTQISFNY